MGDKEIEEIRRKKIEEILRRQNNPKTKAKEFANAILECEEYGDFMRYNKELQRDQTTQSLLSQLQEKQAELQWHGFSPDTLKELRILQLKINQNKTIQNFVKSQQELFDVLRRTNIIISGHIGMQFAFFQGGGCCG